jgi:hypothetical protein
MDFPDGKEFPVGEGKLVLDRDTLRYEGSYGGEKGYTYEWKREHLSGVVAKPGVFVELYHDELSRLLRFVVKQPGHAIQLKVLCEAKIEEYAD